MPVLKILYEGSITTHNVEDSVHQGMDEEPRESDIPCESVEQASMLLG